MTPIANLNRLAPDIEDKLQFLPRATCGRELIRERILWSIAAENARKKSGDTGPRRAVGEFEGGGPMALRPYEAARCFGLAP